MSSPFCLTVLKCVPYIDSVSWELSSREKLKAEAVINRGRWLCSCLCPFSVQVKLLKEQKECEGIRKANWNVNQEGEEGLACKKFRDSLVNSPISWPANSQPPSPPVPLGAWLLVAEAAGPALCQVLDLCRPTARLDSLLSLSWPDFNISVGPMPDFMKAHWHFIRWPQPGPASVFGKREQTQVSGCKRQAGLASGPLSTQAGAGRRPFISRLRQLVGAF